MHEVSLGGFRSGAFVILWDVLPTWHWRGTILKGYCQASLVWSPCRAEQILSSLTPMCCCFLSNGFFWGRRSLCCFMSVVVMCYVSLLSPLFFVIKSDFCSESVFSVSNPIQNSVSGTGDPNQLQMFTSKPNQHFPFPGPHWSTHVTHFGSINHGEAFYRGSEEEISWNFKRPVWQDSLSSYWMLTRK